MYLAGYTMQEIADAVNLSMAKISETCSEFATLEKVNKNLANFQDSEMVSENPTHYHNLP